MPLGHKHQEQAFTVETGAQAALEIPQNHDVSYRVKAGGTDDVDVEVALEVGGTFVAIDSAIAADKIGNIDGPIAAIRITINTNNSNDIELEVLSSFRGG